MAKKTLQDYLMGVRKTHEYTIRVALPEITSEQMTRIENNLKAYELLKVSKPKKTIWQRHPMGFAEPVFSEITIFEIETGLPASNFYLAREIAKILKISEIHVVVNESNHPFPELDLTPDENYVSKVSTDPAYPEDKNLPPHSETFGMEYNKNMLDTILKARKDNPSSIIQDFSNKPKKK